MIFFFTKNPNLKKNYFFWWGWGGVGGGIDGQTDKQAQTPPPPPQPPRDGMVNFAGIALNSFREKHVLILKSE